MPSNKMPNNKKQKVEIEKTLDATFTNNGFNELEITVTYDDSVITFFKTIQGRKYDKKSKAWIFPIDKYEELKDGLEAENVNILSDLTKEELAVNDGVRIIEVLNDKYMVMFNSNSKVTSILEKVSAELCNSVWITDQLEELVKQFTLNKIKYRIEELDEIKNHKITMLECKGDNNMIKSHKFSRRVYLVFRKHGAKYTTQGIYEVPKDKVDKILDELVDNGVDRDDITYKKFKN